MIIYIGEAGVMQTELTEMETTVFIALNGPPPVNLLASPRCNKVPKTKHQPASSCTFGGHVCKTFCGKQNTPDESANIIQFGYETRDGVPVPVIAQAYLGPPCFCEVHHCECKARGKNCSTECG